MSVDIAGIDDLTPDPRNANSGSERGAYMLRTSLEAAGAGRSIVVDRNGVIIAGNKTIEAAEEMGLALRVVKTRGGELVVVQREDLDLLDDDGRARFLAYADNRTSEVGLDWDAEVILGDIDGGVDLSALFREDELAQFTGVANGAGEPGTQVDRATELQAEWGTKLGQVWHLGDHRLAIGDCTDPAVIEAAMGGERAQAMWTDPPYGVAYVGGTADALTLVNDDAEGLLALLTDTFGLVVTVLLPGSPWYIAAPAGPRLLDFTDALRAVGWQLHQMLVWVKDAFVLGHSDYHYRHEMVLYGYVPGEGRSGRGAHKGSRWFGDNARSSVFEVTRPRRSGDHPTMKPVELVVPMLENSTRPGEIVFDPFVGSGTTILACERVARCARAVELDPKYAAVTIQRWADATDGEPVLVTP